MPIAKLADIKPPYLETIALVRGYLKEELGKTGPVSIPISELRSIAAPWKVNRYLGQLAQDKLIEPVTEIPTEVFDSEEPGDIIINCLKTIEEIQAYRHSLQGISGHCISFPISNWSILEMRFTNSQEVVVIAHEPAADESRILTYGDLGFSDKRNGKPNVYWEFLLILAKYQGQLSPRERSLPHRNKVSKWKQGLKEQLQEVFRLPSDPFHPFEENHQYEIKFSIQHHEQNTE